MKDTSYNKFLEAASDTFDKWLNTMAQNEDGVEQAAYDELRRYAAQTYGVSPESGLAKTFACFVSGGVVLNPNFDDMIEEEI